ncbi:bifunctional 2-polyprenyl-6-hydroxyphenol methylase/3-demethylubiquinol 3-O-methyltransferase UbiG [Candidatus Pelagibacter communis]|uniref:bifunctional 2-polyprenyl-6-hydroxyphenol methylase/3-demethylubiquinol 3-O-methyltransferase UbiG n=1 Tax=Pelagibacter ubique TaxID=198252 RepID=UPI00094CFB9E|nr:bifunctional 2-polyprenyl-6-hydroxyphenol methylase/3-demethylubiquinol 3-O-methyltransferase UbiG [Candidatus Pelagibacter ubique]
MKSSTINKKEIDKFSKIAEDWWNPEGKFKPLHQFNPERIKYIKDNTIKHFNLTNKDKPFKNLNILDIGCGGGLLSEPMSRLGGNVTGIDASEKNIISAKIHAKQNNLNISYFCSSPENFKSNKKFDLVLNMEIVEHVEDVNFFIKKSSELLKKNGLMFVATLNRTLKSYILAIIGAEYILRWLPIGTHEWNKFLTPEELTNFGRKNSLLVQKIDGMVFNPLSNRWKVSRDCAVNYIIKFKKN